MSSPLFGSVCFVIACEGAADADCQGDGDTSGSGTKYVGASGSEQHWSWNLSGRQIYVGSTTGSGMSTSVCLDAAADWMTKAGDGHYDARFARNCRPGSFYGGTFTEPSDFGGSSVTGLQKAAGCRYVQTANPYYDDCAYDTESAVNPDTGSYCKFSRALPWTSKCAGFFIRHEDGTVDINNGGDVNSCSN